MHLVVRRRTHAERSSGVPCHRSNVTVDKAKLDATTDPFTWVIGDTDGAASLANCGDPRFDPVPGNFIVGGLTFDSNASGGVISNNNIEGALNWVNNTPPPSGSGNQVDGANTGQCAALSGGTGGVLTTAPDPRRQRLIEPGSAYAASSRRREPSVRLATLHG
jgi:hypothetical protein